ncbi:HNH endonuclease [Fibrella forsythiae]|uniref:HNH endonuclease n=1 Tax=Fibrella forsythiae TaxID=2817061 RepID=A0ABS3JBZ7_9BACT|nr:HNH endonuclease signature motif containing protein [Fibrella forsythiae]MBO0947511.1 HNH endonuclease [Fibrella forsythiae]
MDAATKWLIREAYQIGEPASEIALRLDLPESEVNKVLQSLKKVNRPVQVTPSKAPVVFRVVLIDYDPEWRKELTAKLRTTPLYLDWRRAVLRRGRWRCRECGSTKRVQVDHIYPLSAIIHNYRINSLEEAAECELLWRVDNGRTLCPTCHQRTDTHGAKAQRYWVGPDNID